MRLFHVSEENNIEVFNPRSPTRNDLDKCVKLVWAIDEARLPNFLTPRNCPRVTYHIGKNSSSDDIRKYFSSPDKAHAIVLENKWYEKMKSTVLYVYEFNPKDFILQDEIAGYYISTVSQTPIAKFQFSDLISELLKRNIEIRFVDNLWDIAEDIKKSTLNWSLCRMNFAEPKPNI